MLHPDGGDGTDNDDEPELVTPEDFAPPSPFPADARRLGVDRWSDDAGMIAVAASLDPAKTWHKVIAWVMLVTICGWLAATWWFEIT